jgi:hypothetical protein
VIQVGRDHSKAIDDTIRALSTDTRLFQRGGQLVHIVRPSIDAISEGVYRPAGSPRIVEAPEGRLREVLNSVADFQVYNQEKDEQKRISLPKWIVHGVRDRGEWAAIRQLKSVTEVPVLRPDGTIFAEPGYDVATGLYYEPNCSVDVPTEPTHEDAKNAAKTLLELVADFPFESEHHKSAWLAYLLTPIAVHAYNGPAPLTLVEANVAGAGKSLLCEIVSLLVSGRPAAVSPYSGDNEETRKVITSVVMAGDPMVVFDNVTGSFGSPALDAALTGRRWRDRVLGTNTTVDLPLNIVWAATGNNAELTGDLIRRMLHIKLDSKHEYPEDNVKFEIKNLRQHVLDNRPKLLRAVLTVLRAYCVADRPDMGLTPWGSFEGWSGLIRSALKWVGLPDPNDARIVLREGYDSQHSALEAFICALEEMDPDNNGMTAAEIGQRCIRDYEKSKKALTMFDALVQLGANPDKPISIGMRLKSVRGRVVNGRRLMDRRERSRQVYWHVQHVKPEGGETGET